MNTHGTTSGHFSPLCRAGRPGGIHFPLNKLTGELAKAQGRSAVAYSQLEHSAYLGMKDIYKAQFGGIRCSYQIRLHTI